MNFKILDSNWSIVFIGAMVIYLFAYTGFGTLLCPIRL